MADPNDPYAKHKRPQQQKAEIDPRFVFKDRPKSFFMPTPSSPRASMDAARPDDKRASVFGPRKDSVEVLKKEKDHHHSMSDLKRFFKFGSSKKDKSEKSSKEVSKPSKTSRKGTATPPSRTNSLGGAIPFADDHGLEAKYGKFEKILGKTSRKDGQNDDKIVCVE